MPTLYINAPGTRVRRADHQLVASSPAGELARVPLAQLDLVVIQGPCDVTAPAIAACLRRGIPVAYLDYRGAYLGRLEPPMPRVAALQRAQLRLAEDEVACLALARAVVRGKLRGTRANLRRWAVPEVEALTARIQHAERHGADADGLDVLRGHEGAGAAAYFQGLASALPDEWGFAGRSFHPPGDPFNALLSYLYSLLHVRLVGAVAASGLNPYLGFFHADREGHATLASDLIEEWRPLVDRLAVRLAREGGLQPSAFDVTSDGGWRLGREPRSLVLRAWDARLERSLTLPAVGSPLPLRVALIQQALHFARHVRAPAEEPYLPVDFLS